MISILSYKANVKSYERIQVSPNPHFLCPVSHGRSLIRGEDTIVAIFPAINPRTVLPSYKFSRPPAIFLP